MFAINFINNPSFNINEKIVKSITKTISKNVFNQQNGTLNIIFVSPDEIQELNKNYRQKDYVTDVLSFHYFDDFSKLKTKDTAWEIIMCEEKIKSQAIEYKLWEEKEFYKLLIHSILHIIWYDHEEDDDYEIMNKIETSIWKEIFEKNMLS